MPEPVLEAREWAEVAELGRRPVGPVCGLARGDVSNFSLAVGPLLPPAPVEEEETREEAETDRLDATLPPMDRPSKAEEGRAIPV